MPRPNTRSSLMVALLTATALNTAATTSPDAARTVLVVNAASWASTRLANEYVAQRGIPPANIIYLPGVNAFDEMPVEAFRNEILGPVLHEIEARGLRHRVDSIVYSADFPTTIDVSADVKGRTLPPMLAPHASINGLTFFATLVMARDAAYLDLNCNPYARKLAKDAHDTDLSAEERQKLAQALEGLHKRPPGNPAPEQKQKDLEAVIATLEELRQAHPRSAVLLYNLACGKAQRGDLEGAMASLHDAVAAGWSDAHSTARDRDFKSLRDREDFKALVAKLQALPIAVTPSQSFSRIYDGREYWLSTMLACTSGRGLAVDEVVAGLRRSAAADGWHELTIAVSPQNPEPLLAVLSVPVWLANHAGARLEASVPAAEIPWDKGLNISLALPGAKELWLSHNGREVGRVSGDRGTITIDPKTLGQGPVRLQPFALISDAPEPRTVNGAPLFVTVAPPAALAAVELPAGRTLADGMLLVDDASCAWPASTAGGWRFVPVHLAKGLHRVACKGKADSEAVLDMRFGGPGTRRLAAPRFQHLPPLRPPTAAISCP